MIEAEGLTKDFGSLRAVNGVSFQCKPGEVFGLLGPNGAGKTTTLRMISTVLKPTSGTARVMGFDVRKDPRSVCANIGVLGGETGLYGRLTPFEIVAYYGRLHGMDRKTIERRSDDLFRMLDLVEVRDRKTENFSKGMKQKVAIAQSLIHDPKAFLFDEPTSGLDVMSARTVHDFVFRCRGEGKTIMFCTHVMSEAEKMCDRIAIIDRGVIVITGSKQEILDRTDTSSLEEAFLKVVEKKGE